ncbi:MAG: ATP-binding cassette domain-containing protein [Thermofilum sp.]
MLSVSQLYASVDGTEIIKGVDLEVGEGEVHLLLGPNGAGKTTLLSAIAGLPRVRVTRGRIALGGVEVTGLPAYERARLGLVLAYQIPPELTGIPLGKLAAMLAERFGTKPHFEELASLLGLGHLLGRDAFRGFSGGERKRAEVFLTALLRPKVALLDEPDSGVDVDSVSLIAEAVRYMAAEFNSSVIVVTHTQMLASLLGSVPAHVLVDGRIACKGDAESLLDKLRKRGFGGVCEQ